MEKSIKKRWVMGLEPTVSRTTIWRVSQLRHTHHKNKFPIWSEVCPKGLEPPTPGLEGRCSIQLSYGHIIQAADRACLQLSPKRQLLKRVMGIEPTYLAWKASVLPLNYTRILMKDYLIHIWIGVTGFEPATSWSQTKRSTKLSNTPEPISNASVIIIWSIEIVNIVFY